MKRARALTKTIAKDYARNKKAAEAEVVRWEWVTKKRHSYVPAYFETRNQVRGRAIKAAPATWDYQVQEGFDHTDRLIVERRRTNTTGSQYETFYCFAKDGIEMLDYSYETWKPKQWNCVAWLPMVDGRVIEEHWVGNGEGEFTRTFGYDSDGRVVGYDETGIDDNGEATAQSFEIEHDAKGIVRTWWLKAGKRTTPYWQRGGKPQR
jgi:hypothetical protein